MMPPGEIGEIIVRGPVATREYFRRPEATAMAKIADGSTFWHRMGDVGYLDADGRLWFCGRKAHIVHSTAGPMYSVCCEAIFDNHPTIYRTALVGAGVRGKHEPVIVAEPEPGKYPETERAQDVLKAELLDLGTTSPLTQSIRTILFHRSLPVDTRPPWKPGPTFAAKWKIESDDSTITPTSVAKSVKH